MRVEGVADETEQNQGYRQHVRPEMRKFLPQDAVELRVLEIGCADGSFSSGIGNAKELWGIEPYAPAAEIASRRLFRVFTSTFEGARKDLPVDYFDLVICNDVIEHMTDHDRFLSDIQVHMKDRALLVGSLPNVRYYKNLFNVVFARDWEYEDSGILDRTHFRFFTFKSWRRSLAAAGFEIEALKGLNGGFSWDWTPWSIAYGLFAYGLIGLTMGRARDVRHLQIGFRARRAPR